MPDAPVDLTEELPLDDENVLAPEQTSVWRRYRWPIVGVVVVLVAAAVGLTLWLTSGSSTPTGLSVTTVTVPVTTGTIQQTVASSGTIEPASQANLNFAVSGTVTAVNVKAGQTVTAGQALATVATTALAEDVNAAQAQVTSAEDRLASDEASGAAASQLDIDEASVTSAESSLSTAQTNLDDASLTSTISGTVASVSLTVGQQVTGTGSGSGSGNGAARRARRAVPTVQCSSIVASGQIVVIGTDSYIVNTTVDDTEIGQITTGDQVDITPTGSTTPDLRHGRLHQPHRQPELRRHHLSRRRRRDGQSDGSVCRSSADVSIIVKQLNDVTEVPTRRHLLRDQRPGHRHRR